MWTDASWRPDTNYKLINTKSSDASKITTTAQFYPVPCQLLSAYSVSSIMGYNGNSKNLSFLDRKDTQTRDTESTQGLA